MCKIQQNIFPQQRLRVNWVTSNSRPSQGDGRASKEGQSLARFLNSTVFIGTMNSAVLDGLIHLNGWDEGATVALMGHSNIKWAPAAIDRKTVRNFSFLGFF